MNHWGGNIRFLRKRAGLSQEALAAALAMTRVKLNAHESAKTANPTTKDLTAVSDYFKISIDHLIRTDLASLSEKDWKEIGKHQPDLRVLAITINDDNEELVDYVPVKAKAGYRAGHRDPEYMAALPKCRFPDLDKGKTFRLFPTVGDSMLPIPEGSDVLAWFIEDWQSIKPGTLCIVVLRGEQEFVFKELSPVKPGQFLLRSLNEAYQPFVVSAADVLEIWAYDRFISREVPAQGTELDEIKSLLMHMRRELKNE